ERSPYISAIYIQNQLIMKAITIISVPVTDQQAAKQFYLNLGFTLLVEGPFGPGQNWVQLALPGQEALSITLVTWFPELTPGCIRGFVIKVDNLADEIKDLGAKGIEVGKIDETPWGKFAAVKDPDGNTWSLHEE
ncbi:MAG: VOC family protein, partial [Mucilaginibacter sp.]